MDFETIDFENDFLIIYKDTNGKFTNSRWYSAKKNNRQNVTATLQKWNEAQTPLGEKGRFAEIVDDPFIRSIFAYREKAAPLEEIIESASEAQKAVDTAVENLETALTILGKVNDLDQYPF